MTSDLEVLIFIPTASNMIGSDSLTFNTEVHFFQNISNPVTLLILCVWLSQPGPETSGLLGSISWEPNLIVVLFCSYRVGMAWRDCLVTLLRSSKRPFQSMLWNWESACDSLFFFFTDSPFHPMQHAVIDAVCKVNRLLLYVLCLMSDISEGVERNRSGRLLVIKL